ncbi:MAG TPA: bifunctional phosphopantothenoylcysteine decarboxylase/phosphopantothenate--cysteine ligase CoaBC [Thermoleophilaceae bacterium]|nr:bifunctional phosphopantothenoylcysteine decarboxylase/phosphopantothenate--cysteine ligase CoaBC [Thermoleophilaceae bacterium]
MARLLFGVSGGIAAYKAVELVRLATGEGHAVRVIQTETSLRFVGRATFEAVTGAPVLVDEFEPDPARGAFPGDPPADHAPISHLELVRRCDALCVAPASANTIAKLAAGLADNLLTSAALAAEAPLLLAPAMNDRMYAHPATRANLDRLRERGARIVAPGRGRLASKGECGEGRLAEPAEILAAIGKAIELSGRPFGFAPRSLDGMRVLVTGGGTREPIDAVRFVGNRSSGRMGLALAAEAARRGAEVTLVAANVSLPTPSGVEAVRVQTAAELRDACLERVGDADVVLMAAAPVDFRPSEPIGDKIKKAGRDHLTLELEPTDDVLSALAEGRAPGQTLVGFAAEHGPERAVAEAREKLARKGVDAVVVNDISRSDIGFEAEENEVAIVTADDVRQVARASKEAVAAAVLDAVEELRAAGETRGGVGARTLGDGK